MYLLISSRSVVLYHGALPRGKDSEASGAADARGFACGLEIFRTGAQCPWVTQVGFNLPKGREEKQGFFIFFF